MKTKKIISIIFNSIVSLVLLVVLLFAVYAVLVGAFATIELLVITVLPIWGLVLILNIISWVKIRKENFFLISIISFIIVMICISFLTVRNYPISKRYNKWHNTQIERAQLYENSCTPKTTCKQDISGCGLSSEGYDCPPLIKEKIEKLDAVILEYNTNLYH